MQVQCELCPKACVIAPGQSGECRIRVNLDGKLRAVTYGHPCSANVDPVEKKPLYHYRPGSRILSLATVGCNLHCKNCQNWQISQQDPETAPPAVELAPEDVAPLARRTRCRSVAYTYTDPVVYYEYALDTCRDVREAGLGNVLVTAAYVNREPFEKLCAYVDAANIDLKAFSDDFYREVCSGTLQPVLDALVLAKSMGIHLEVTNLVIPTLNDSDEMLGDLCRWIVRNLGGETPLHFSRFFPKHLMARGLPPTPPETLNRARRIALDEGLDFVYIGNLPGTDASDTRCPSCQRVLIARRRYRILSNDLDQGRCPACRKEIYGRWD